MSFVVPHFAFIYGHIALIFHNLLFGTTFFRNFASSFFKKINMKRASYFYLLLAGLLLSSNGAFSQTWEERIVNGDFEGSD